MSRATAESPTRSVAFHEGLADLVALLVRFFEPGVVARIIRTHGTSLEGTPLLQIAMQFGAALKSSGSLALIPGKAGSSAIQRQKRATPIWVACSHRPSWRRFWPRTTIRPWICCGSTAASPKAATCIPTSSGGWLTKPRFSRRGAARSTIAAVDYLPPVGLAFFDVLRAVLATDTMLFGKANQGYRSLLVQAFHKRGLIPRDAGSLATGGADVEPERTGTEPTGSARGRRLVGGRHRWRVSPPVHGGSRHVPTRSAMPWRCKASNAKDLAPRYRGVRPSASREAGARSGPARAGHQFLRLQPARQRRQPHRARVRHARPGRRRQATAGRYVGV